MSKKSQNKEKLIVLYDGTCNLCNNVVSFIARNDSRKIFCFVKLESEKASEYLLNNNMENVNRGSVILIQDDRTYLRSAAVLHIIKHLDGLWPLLHIFIIIPPFLRDPVYNLIARHRKRWFGTCTDCDDISPC